MNRCLSLLMTATLLTGCPKPQKGTGPATYDPDPAPRGASTSSGGSSASSSGSTASEAAPEPVKTPISERVNNAVAKLTTPNAANHRQAVAALQEVLIEDPQLVVAHFNLGVAHYLLEEYSSALREFKLAVALDESHEMGWLYQGHTQNRMGRQSDAVGSYRSGVQRFPENMEFRVALVHGLRQQGLLDQAVVEAKAGLGVNSNSLPTYNAMGLCYVEMGELDLAQFVFEKAEGSIAGAESSAELQANLGWTHYLLDERHLAEARLKKAVSLDPGLIRGLVYLARMYIEDHNYTEAVPLLERAVQATPDDQGLQMDLGIAYRGVGNYTGAKAAYEKALKLDPGNPDPWMNLGILQGDYLKEYEDSVSSFERYIATGGAQVELAAAHIEAVQTEQERSEKRRLREESRQAADLERAERQRLLEEAERQANPDAPGGGSEGDASPEEGNESAGDDSPWGPVEE